MECGERVKRSSVGGIDSSSQIEFCAIGSFSCKAKRDENENPLDDKPAERLDTARLLIFSL
jgi:hypothetical protein